MFRVSVVVVWALFLSMASFADGAPPDRLSFEIRFAEGRENVDVDADRIVEPSGDSSRTVASGETTLVYGNAASTEPYAPGAFRLIADDLSLNVNCGCHLHAIEITLSGGGDGTGGGLDALIGLYDVCPSEGGQLLSGTQGAVSIPDDATYQLTVTYPEAPFITEDVWLALVTNAGHGAWFIGSPAAIGTTTPFFDPGLPGASCDTELDGQYFGVQVSVTCGPPIDCNGNGTVDRCEILSGQADDCNANLVPDSCDVNNGTSADCDNNGVPDECDVVTTDCNANGVPDACDVANGTSEDCNSNLNPDECETDCNANDRPDDCDIALQLSEDCNENAVPDECDVADGTSADCDENGIPDACDPDCNANELVDVCELTNDPSLDCDGNLVLDSCELSEPSADCNQNGVLDDCDMTGTSAVLSDDFSSGMLDPARWSSSSNVDVYASGSTGHATILGEGGWLESVSLDLAGAYRASMLLNIGLCCPGYNPQIDIDFWTGSEWRTGVIFHPYDALNLEHWFAELRQVDIPAYAFHEAFRFRVRIEEPGQIHLDSIEIVKQEGDCDGSGILDACESPGSEGNDCNANNIPDDCERNNYIPGFGERYDTGPWPNSVKIADFNRDGLLDIAVGQGPYWDDGTLNILLNDGYDRFVLRESVETPANPRNIAVGDFNKDGWPDVLAACLYGDRLSFAENIGGAWWGMPQSAEAAVISEPLSVAVADFNQDGHLDAAVSAGDSFQSGGGAPTLYLFLNDGEAQFTLFETFDLEDDARSLTTFDANNDGLDDLAIVAQIDNSVQFLINAGFDEQGAWLGMADEGAHPIVEGGQGPFFIDAADFNGDGLDDLAVGITTIGGGLTVRVEVQINAGTAPDGTWQGISETRVWPLDSPAPALRAHDFDKDGWTDLVIGLDEGRIELIQNLGLDTSGEWIGFQEMAEVETDYRPHDIAVDDLNRDGIADIVVANRATGNGGSPMGEPSVHVIMGIGPWSTDCNDNGVNDQCDIADGVSADIDDNGVPDECQDDCNGNATPDELEIAMGTADDCNNNQSIDECDIASAESEDCNANGIPDECEFTYSETSPIQVPFCCDDLFPATLDLTGAPRAGKDVRVEVEAVTAYPEPVSLWFNGLLLAEDLFHGENDCYPAATAALYIPRDTFNEAMDSGDPTVEARINLNYGTCPVITYQVNPILRTNPAFTYAKLSVDYGLEDAQDCNRNLRPDSCDLADGTSMDCDENDAPDSCQPLAVPRIRTFAAGLDTPETVVPSQPPYPDGYLVPDIGLDAVMHVTPDGLSATEFSESIQRPVTIEWVPQEFDDAGGRFYVNSQTSNTIEVLSPDGTLTTFDSITGVLDVNGFTYVPSNHPSSWANSLIVSARTFHGGELIGVRPNGLSDTITPFPDDPLWTPTLVPSDFGDLGNQIMIGTLNDSRVFSIDLNGFSVTQFARLPLPEGSGIRMITFSPIGWGTWLNRLLEDERVVVITSSTTVQGGVAGRLDILDQRGSLLATVSQDALGMPIDPRGVRFEPDRLLICEIGAGRLLDISLTSLDCNGDEIPDGCEIDADPELDLNNNGVVDACDTSGDFDGDGWITLRDWAALQNCFGHEVSNEPASHCSLVDADGDDQIDLTDHALIDITWP